MQMQWTKCVCVYVYELCVCVCVSVNSKIPGDKTQTQAEGLFEVLVGGEEHSLRFVALMSSWQLHKQN